SFLFCYYVSVLLLVLLSFPTRRSSDLPSVFHVRNDGWMGICFSFDGPRTVRPNETVRLRYGLYVHSRTPTPKELQQKWGYFSGLDRKSTRLNSSHRTISYAVFCLKKKI